MRLNYIDRCDCLDGMKAIPDGSVDMVLCDLPYGVTKNKWDSVIDLDALWREYKRVTKPNGAICLFADGMFMAKLMTSEPQMWRYNLVWNKMLVSGFLNANKMPLRQTEEICVFYRKLPTYNPQKTEGVRNHSKGRAVGREIAAAGLANNNYGSYAVVDNSAEQGCMKHPTSLMTFQKPHPSKSVHPTEKPVALCEYLIKTYTNPGEVVLDNCMGSGTTAVACLRTGRNYIGYEISVDYCQIARKRVAEVAAELAEHARKGVQHGSADHS